ncbi:EF-hand [Lichtheimia hyalospora FSU 10163]|nr:EF-hand [Lichtheimia hyalospora FSU 10163]
MLHSTPIPNLALDKPPQDTTPDLPVSSEELESLRQAFRIFDSTGTGSITISQFSKIVKNLNIATDPNEIDCIARSVDLNNDHVIDFEEFATAMIRHLAPLHPAQEPLQCTTTPSSRSVRNKRISFHDEMELLQCFQAFDKNGDNRISQQELAEVMISLGERLSSRDLQAMMNEADINRDGFIDFEEFKQLLPS